MVHPFRFDHDFFLLDVESGAVHCVDELIYDIVNAKLAEKDVGLLEKKYSAAELQDAENELKELETNEELFTKEKPFVPMQGEPVIKSLCLNVAHDCNMRCDYCFASTGEYHLGRTMMSFEVGARAIDFLIAYCGGRKHLEVDFFGGEPLMNFDVVKQLVGYGREQENKYSKKIAFTMTTNGLLINDDIIEFCNKEFSNVVISLDGRKQTHDAVRKTINGLGSYDAIVPKAKALGLSRQKLGKEYYIRGTYTRDNLDFTNDVLAIADLGFEQISIEPVILPDENPRSIREEDLQGIYSEYEKLAHEYYKRRKNGAWFNFFHFMIDLGNGPCLAKRITGCGAGSEYIAVTPQGDIYPCHQFVGNIDFRMGSVLTGEIDCSMQKAFRDCHIFSKIECSKCWAKYYCCGGCAANARNLNGSIYKPCTLSCEIEKKRVECAIAIYAKEKQDIG